MVKLSINLFFCLNEGVVESEIHTNQFDMKYKDFASELLGCDKFAPQTTHLSFVWCANESVHLDEIQLKVCLLMDYIIILSTKCAMCQMV